VLICLTEVRQLGLLRCSHGDSSRAVGSMLALVLANSLNMHLIESHQNVGYADEGYLSF
jgi:hypothetical protein